MEIKNLNKIEELRQRKEVLCLRTEEVRQRFILLKKKSRKVAKDFRRVLILK